ncbi:MAG TPA: hypothetical protein VF595_02885 [Tepidisphaeraceae bacterium]|jgi:hypothetical protein
MNITPTGASIGTCSINRLSATTNSRIATAVTTPLSRPRPPELVLISLCRSPPAGVVGPFVVFIQEP